MLRYTRLIDDCARHDMKEWALSVKTKAVEYFSTVNHGDYAGWCDAIQSLPEVSALSSDMTDDAITLMCEEGLSNTDKKSLTRSLKALMPWRKGPFQLFDVYLDAEWRSNLKWDRLQERITPLEGRSVLDIGCGNGYYGWRMLGAGASLVVGVDPTLKFAMQFQALKYYLPELPFYFLPFTVQDLSPEGAAFDTVFSMGVIYHRRDPVEHCQQLMKFLKSGGELILETLIVDDAEDLVPEGRYAKMNNVWCVPTTDTLLSWLKQAGFENAHLIDICKTTIEEQRRTEWMTFESLDDFLDPDDGSKTLEGYPAPVRAIVIAEKP